MIMMKLKLSLKGEFAIPVPGMTKAEADHEMGNEKEVAEAKEQAIKKFRDHFESSGGELISADVEFEIVEI